MSPYERIYREYQRAAPTIDFPRMVGTYLTFGYVFSTPEFFVMGRPIDSRAPECDRNDATHAFPDPDCWLIVAFSGPPETLWRILPFDLPRVAWERMGTSRKELRVFPMARLRSIHNVPA